MSDRFLVMRLEEEGRGIECRLRLDRQPIGVTRAEFLDDWLKVLERAFANQAEIKRVDSYQGPG